MNDYITERTAICKACPIYDCVNEVCSSRLYLNPKNNNISTEPKLGYIKGCGCHLKFKIKNKSAICPAKKWTSVF